MREASNPISLYRGRTTSKKNRFHSALVRRASPRSDSTSCSVRDIFRVALLPQSEPLVPGRDFCWVSVHSVLQSHLDRLFYNFCSVENTVHLALLYTTIQCRSSHMYILVRRETGLALCLQPSGDLPIVNRRLWSPSPKLHHFSTDVVADTLSDRLVTDSIAACTLSQGCLSTNHLGHCLHHKAWVVWQRISSISVAATLRGGCVRCVINPWRGT